MRSAYVCLAQEYTAVGNIEGAKTIKEKMLEFFKDGDQELQSP